MKKETAGINEIELLVNNYSNNALTAEPLIKLIKRYQFSAMSLELAMYNLQKNQKINKNKTFTELRILILEELIKVKNPLINNHLNIIKS
jgi:hypothetical protein